MRRLFAAVLLSVLGMSACSGGSTDAGYPAVDGPLVIGVSEVEQLPGVVPCPPPSFQDNREAGGGLLRSDIIVNMPPVAAPEEALEAFLIAGPPDGQQQLAQSGYVELHFPDSPDMVVFGRDFGGGYVTLVGVYRDTGGWAARWWAGSGC